jgi:hypothetical protein
VAEPKNPGQPRMREWPMFSRGKQTRRAPKRDGRPWPTIAELLMEHVPGTPSEKLAWLQHHAAAGGLDGDDPDEIAQAEALLAMLARYSGSKPDRQTRHLDELLDEGLQGTFPASDPVAVGDFTSTEAPRRPTDRAAVVPVAGMATKRKRAPPRMHR